MNIKTLNGVSDTELLEVFNLAFSDYFIPLQLTLDQFQSKLKADQTKLDLSVGAFENEKLIGFILHGKAKLNCKSVIYNGATGVIPEKRGRKLTQRMYDFILPILRAKSFDHLLLEVISENHPAIKSYENVGYYSERRLICFKGELSIAPIETIFNIREISDYNWSVMQSFWDVLPSWQNSRQSIEQLKIQHKLIGAYSNNELIGYLIYHPKTKRMQQLAVCKEYRNKDVAKALVTYLSENYDKNLSIINVDETSKSAINFLTGIGLKPFITQLEMKLKLKS
ncbi:GNAT family N-acetyltransferase [uncultured Psychroserpens sp.]|uniref:GNAT family N-acetyltransferase n=1 Tax=uncultured Psychroserpens sp. TaxID=255436 RepID=UPI0026072680|nr:GNAT family N-acetyltransferase [uncultured Psychroserpens sp.]